MLWQKLHANLLNKRSGVQIYGISGISSKRGGSNKRGGVGRTFWDILSQMIGLNNACDKSFCALKRFRTRYLQLKEIRVEPKGNYTGLGHDET